MRNSNENPTKLLLHACCGPCTLEPSRLLREEGWQLRIFYANSNIHPSEEYARRLETLRTWAAGEGLEVTEGSYDITAWEATAGRIGDTADDPIALRVDPEKRLARCRACYRLRFEEAARYAAEHGFDALGTTLSVSPYQYTSVIREELERAAAKAGIKAVFRDFRPYYDEATHRSRELGMYRQNYCGCRFSEAEAAAERAERKAARATEREARMREQSQSRAAEEAARAANRAEKQAYADKQARKRAILKQMREQGR